MGLDLKRDSNFATNQRSFGGMMEDVGPIQVIQMLMVIQDNAIRRPRRMEKVPAARRMDSVDPLLCIATVQDVSTTKRVTQVVME